MACGKLSKRITNSVEKYPNTHFVSIQNKIEKNFLASAKDKINPVDKSGIYEIKCNGCDKNTLTGQKNAKD